MSRFVILTHDHPQLHWDLMLEQGDVLWTWRLSAEPASHVPITAERLPDHRKLYLDYEGPVSENRGTVIQWDTGTYELISSKNGQLHGIFSGQILRGSFVISESIFTLS